jgi:hypothetical protein
MNCETASELAKTFRLSPVSDAIAEAQAQQKKFAAVAKAEFERSLGSVAGFAAEEIAKTVFASLETEVLDQIDAELAPLGQAVRKGKVSPKEFVAFIDNEFPGILGEVVSEFRSGMEKVFEEQFKVVTSGWCAAEGAEFCIALKIESVDEIVLRAEQRVVDRVAANRHVKWVRANYSTVQRQYAARAWRSMSGIQRMGVCGTVTTAAFAVIAGSSTEKQCNAITYEITGMSCSRALDSCNRVVGALSGSSNSTKNCKVYCKCDSTGAADWFQGSCPQRGCPSSGSGLFSQASRDNRWVQVQTKCR